MQTQYSLLYFHDFKLEMENGHSDRKIDHEIKIQEARKNNLVESSLELLRNVLLKKYCPIISNVASFYFI